jgi:hypothetical protein
MCSEGLGEVLSFCYLSWNSVVVLAARLKYLDCKLSEDTAGVARGHKAVCVFVNDSLSADVLETLAKEVMRRTK